MVHVHLILALTGSLAESHNLAISECRSTEYVFFESVPPNENDLIYLTREPIPNSERPKERSRARILFSFFASWENLEHTALAVQYKELRWRLTRTPKSPNLRPSKPNTQYQVKLGEKARCKRKPERFPTISRAVSAFVGYLASVCECFRVLHQFMQADSNTVLSSHRVHVAQGAMPISPWCSAWILIWLISWFGSCVTDADAVMRRSPALAHLHRVPLPCSAHQDCMPYTYFILPYRATFR